MSIPCAGYREDAENKRIVFVEANRKKGIIYLYDMEPRITINNKDFDFERVAQGYKNRPFLHKQAIEKFQRDVTDKTFSNGLEMIAVAKKICEDEEYDFIVSRAEETPILNVKV